MGWFFGKHFDRVNDVREVDGKDTQFYALEDGASAMGNKTRLAFNWTRPDGKPSKYAINNEERAECVDELTKQWEDDRQYL